MIINLNKVYFMSAPPETLGMTSGEDSFVESALTNVTYTKMKRVHVTKPEEVVRAIAKVFDLKGRPMQGVFYFTDLPEAEAKKRLNEAISRLLSNARDGSKAQEKK